MYSEFYISLNIDAIILLFVLCLGNRRHRCQSGAKGKLIRYIFIRKNVSMNEVIDVHIPMSIQWLHTVATYSDYIQWLHMVTTYSGYIQWLHTVTTYSGYIWWLHIKILIYHEFLPPPMRGSHVKSDNTHTLSNIHPLAHILDICALIFSSCALFTVYPNPKRHPIPIQVITTSAREGGPKEQRAKQKWPRGTYSVTYVLGLSTLSDHRNFSVAKGPRWLHLLATYSDYIQWLHTVTTFRESYSTMFVACVHQL